MQQVSYHKKLSVFATPGRHTFLIPVNRGLAVIDSTFSLSLSLHYKSSLSHLYSLYLLFVCATKRHNGHIMHLCDVWVFVCGCCTAQYTALYIHRSNLYPIRPPPFWCMSAAACLLCVGATGAALGSSSSSSRNVVVCTAIVTEGRKGRLPPSRSLVTA